MEVSEQLSLLDLLWEGECRRATGATGSNRRSSRSHAIWTLYLTSNREGSDGTGLITTNQVHLVDLAGRLGQLQYVSILTSHNFFLVRPVRLYTVFPNLLTTRGTLRVSQ